MKNAGLLLLVLSACDASTPPPPAAPAQSAAAPVVTTKAKACLMTHICSCNLGCTRVPLDPDKLQEGQSAIAETGDYKGQELKVVKEADANGASVFALADRLHDNACQLETRSLIGFGCAAKNSGAVPVNACAKGCDD